MKESLNKHNNQANCNNVKNENKEDVVGNAEKNDADKELQLIEKKDKNTEDFNQNLLSKSSALEDNSNLNKTTDNV